MSKGLTIYLDSGANIHSKQQTFLTWWDLGLEDEEEWDNLTEDEQEELAKEIAFEWLDWGWTKGDK